MYVVSLTQRVLFLAFLCMIYFQRIFISPIKTIWYNIKRGPFLRILIRAVGRSQTQWDFLLYDRSRRGISGPFFSLALKSSLKSHQVTFFWFKKEVWVKVSSFEWKLYHFEQTKLSFDDFLMTTSEQEKDSERKKEPQIPRLSCDWLSYLVRAREETKWSYFKAFLFVGVSRYNQVFSLSRARRGANHIIAWKLAILWLVKLPSARQRGNQTSLIAPSDG